MIRKLIRNILGENNTKNNVKLASVNFGIILFMFLVSGIMLFFLPEQIPMLHNGAIEHPIPATLGVWLFPIIALVINISFIKQNRLSKMNSIIFAIFVMMLFLLINKGIFYNLVIHRILNNLRRCFFRNVLAPDLIFGSEMLS